MDLFWLYITYFSCVLCIKGFRLKAAQKVGRNCDQNSLLSRLVSESAQKCPFGCYLPKSLCALSCHSVSYFLGILLSRCLANVSINVQQCCLANVSILLLSCKCVYSADALPSTAACSSRTIYFSNISQRKTSRGLLPP